MQTRLRNVLNDVWQHHRSALTTAISESIRGLENVLRLDDYHREGHKEEKLQETMGPFGGGSLNLSSLSNVLSQRPGSRVMSDERRERVVTLKNTLTEILQTCSSEMKEQPSADFSEQEEAIHEKAESHLNRMAGVFRLLRIAQLEIRSKYHGPTHDPLFADFSWRQLSPGELSQCPPFVVFARLDTDNGAQMRKMMALLESRKPIKIAATRTGLKKSYSPTADPSLPATLSLETIPMAMRGIYFLQTCPTVDGFEKILFKALSSPRPGIISYLGHHEDEKDEAYLHRTRMAVRSRAFPVLLYDPDIAPEFVSCFDLAGNPQLDSQWFITSDPEAANQDSESYYTFADFAAMQPEFESEFSNPGADLSSDSLTPINDYIQFSRRQRIGKQPIVELPVIGKPPKQLVASQAVVTQTCDQLHLWKTLRELAGIENPYVQTTRKSLNAEFDIQQKALLESLQEEMEKNQSVNEQAIVASTVRRIVSTLTGVDPASLKLDQ